jgi:hypothetical protein
MLCLFVCFCGQKYETRCDLSKKHTIEQWKTRFTTRLESQGAKVDDKVMDLEQFEKLFKILTSTELIHSDNEDGDTTKVLHMTYRTAAATHLLRCFDEVGSTPFARSVGKQQTCLITNSNATKLLDMDPDGLAVKRADLWLHVKRSYRTQHVFRWQKISHASATCLPLAKVAAHGFCFARLSSLLCRSTDVIKIDT